MTTAPANLPLSQNEQQVISDLRPLVQSVVAGGDPVPLLKALISFYRSIAQAVKHMGSLAPTTPERDAIAASILENYDLVLDCVEAMDEAIESQDEGTLISQFRQAAAAIARVDELLARDRALSP